MMRLIKTGNNDVLKILSPHPEEGSVYRPSSYLLQFEINDGLLLYNTLSGELVLLDGQEKDVFERLPLRFRPELQELIGHHFVITQREFDKEAVIVEQLRSVMLRRKENTGVINHYNILPTTACNARCFYCYESSMPQISMTRETADRLVEYIKAHHGGKKAFLSWFGGEPTLGEKRIDQICSGLRSAGIAYESTMTSNAYLFDEALVMKAKEDWLLKRIQITLDGTEQTYIKTKSYVGIHDNPYERVLRNIGLLLGAGIHVDIRLNLDKHNADDLKTLIEELYGRFRGEKNLFVYVWRLEEEKGFEPIRHSKEEWDEVQRQWIDLQQLLEEKGWLQIQTDTLPVLRTHSCMADNPQMIQCAPDGTFGKCEDKIFEHTVGSLEEGIVDKDQIRWWKERKMYEDCPSCPLFPSCDLLLKHCPAEYKICYDDRKERKIAAYHKLMKNIYSEQKEN